ncbi:MAG: two-component system LytT family response regulator [Crocinitomix sp.]|jgi:two-component system LytT family response regulator
MKALIIEDEFNCSEVLQSMLMQHAPVITAYKIAETVEDGLKKIEAFEPDVVFLDIQLGEQTCFELLDQLKEINFQLIFTTAYDQYAIKAFEYAAVHYLLKPIILSELIEAVKRCEVNQQNTKNEDIENVKNLYLKTSLRDYNITHDDIIYIQADGSYSTVHTSDGQRIFTSKKLVDYERLLPEGFYRIHHSIIVNLKWVSHLDKPNNIVVLSNDLTLPISRRKKADFKKALPKI